MDWMHLGTWLDELTDVELAALESKQADTWGATFWPISI
jgi:hypothetical protein